MNYIQHFNEQTKNYLLFRPDYPQSLYAYLASLVDDKRCAWDCGTGNGQAAVVLTNYFDLVIATDINQAQLEVAHKNKAIRYLCCTAENTPISDHAINLITIAQALHWFNFDLFSGSATSQQTRELHCCLVLLVREN